MNTYSLSFLASVLYFLSLIHFMKYFLHLESLSFPRYFLYTLFFCIISTLLASVFPMIAASIWIIAPFLYSFYHFRKLSMSLWLPAAFLLVFIVQLPVAFLFSRFLSAFFPLIDCSLKIESCLFSCTVAFFLVVLEICLFHETRHSVIPFRLRVLLALVPACSIIIYFILIFVGLWHEEGVFAFLILCGILMITVSNFIYLVVVARFQSLLITEHQNELLVQEAHLKEDYYKEIEQHNQEIHRIKHDLKNQLSGLYNNLNTGNPAIREKLSALLGELEDTGNQLYTSNEILNSILKLKFNDAEKCHIRIEHDVMVPKHMNIEYGDMGILFGNLLDNATEACMRLPECRRWIRLTVNYSSGGLILIVENSKDTDDDVDFHTRKKRPSEHGIGIKSVKRVVEKYDGAIEFIDESDHFEVSAIIYGI